MIMGIRKQASAGLLLLAFCAMAACSRQGSGDAAPAAGARARRLKAIIVPQPTSLLPHETISYVDGQLSDAIFNNLVYADHKGSLAPELAESWDVSADHRVYTFHLRRNVRFHDGRPFTAADVLFTLENLIEKTQARFVETRFIEGHEDFLARRSPHVRGILIRDDHTVQVRLNAEFKFFLPFLAAEYTAILPAALAGKSEEEFRWHPVGTGPFRLAARGNRAIGDHQYLVFSLEKFKGYFAPTGNTEAIDFYASNTSSENSELRHFDLVFVSDSEMLELSAHPGLTVINSSPTILNFLILNPGENAPMRQRLVRQLILHAINREELVRQVFQNQALPAHSMLPFGLLGHNPYHRLEYSRAAAIRAELPPGKISFTLLTVAKDKRRQVGEFVRRELARYDVEVKLVVMNDPFAYFTRGIHEAEGSIILGGIPDYPAAFHFLSHLVEPNGYYNARKFSLPGLQAKIAMLPSADTVNEARMLAEIRADLEKEALYIPLYHYSNFIALRRRIQSITFKYGEVADLARLEVTE